MMMLTTNETKKYFASHSGVLLMPNVNLSQLKLVFNRVTPHDSPIVMALGTLVNLISHAA